MKKLFTNRIFLFILASIIICVIVFCTWFFAFRDTGPMRIRGLAGNDVTQHRVSDYRGSYLELNDNGTFVVLIKFQGENEFLGIGTYNRISRNTYVFTYIDFYRMRDTGSGPAMQRDFELIGWEATYVVSRGNFRLHLIGRYYIFR